MAVQITGASNLPTRVVTGAGRIAELPDACRAHGITRPLLVTDRGLAENDLIAGIARRVREAGIPISVFSDVKGNPTGSNLNAGVAAFKAGGHDGVIAVGGGSALDVGKCVAFMVAQSRPVWDFEDIGDWNGRARPLLLRRMRSIFAGAYTQGFVDRLCCRSRHGGHRRTAH